MKGKLIVVKVGTVCLTNPDGRLNLTEMKRLVDEIAKVVKQGYKVILVTSGAIASGMAELGVKPNPNDIVFKQACAAAGQSILMAHYRELFRRHNLKVAQVLLTKDDLSNRASYIHTCNVLERLLQIGVVPIVNENDVTAIDELIPVTKGYRVNFSDNDILSVLIANAMQADMVIILSNIDGLYTMNPEDPKAELIPVVERVTEELKNMVEGKSRLGRGGIKTKLEAAEIATQSGIPLVIANSRRENVVSDILAGKLVGTYFKPTGRVMSAIKRWIAYGTTSIKGRIILNEGAKKAIMRGASLLAVGVSRVEGEFRVGDVVSLTDESSKEFGRGIANYTSEEINLIKGMKTSQIRKVLGYVRQKEIVSRKRMYLLEEARQLDP
ncbi:MAG: gamma-glutamyl kinase [Candidatus Bathyarchaeota archaeon B26-2]|nr:MAG: gamma-glutamyl kinase [Candidatus Bathyarchaeota archaeon B26-2]